MKIISLKSLQKAYDEDEIEQKMPFPIQEEIIKYFKTLGIKQIHIDDYIVNPYYAHKQFMLDTFEASDKALNKLVDLKPNYDLRSAMKSCKNISILTLEKLVKWEEEIYKK